MSLKVVSVGSSTLFTITFRNEWGQTSYSTSVHVEAPLMFDVSQNYPNPFNASTTFVLSVPVASNIQLTIYNVLGEEIARLVDSHLPAGTHPVQWNAQGFPSGVYFSRTQAGSFTTTKKLLLLK